VLAVARRAAFESRALKFIARVMVISFHQEIRAEWRWTPAFDKGRDVRDTSRSF